MKENKAPQDHLEQEKQPDTEQNLPETEQELPEQITLSREEFLQAKDHIDKLQAENATTVALAQRVQADFDNFRRRNASVRSDSLDEGAREVIKTLLPVLDNFERAIASAGEVDSQWLEGVKLVQKQMLDVLAKHGLEEIPSDGKFDPELHEAVLQEESDGAENGDILQTLQKGYKVKERIIRHSMVKVAK